MSGKGTLRGLACGTMLASVLAIAVPFGLVGCGDSDKEPKVVAPTEAAAKSTRNMQDFMKSQGNKPVPVNKAK
jgi:hypothetical protein